jgi:hypothetical protein
MKEDNIKVFINNHKQAIPDDGFTTHLFNTLDVLPQPKAKRDRKPIIVGFFAMIGILVFVLLGGYSVLLQGLETVGLIFSGAGSITPEIITTFLLLTLAFFALIRFAIHSFDR